MDGHREDGHLTHCYDDGRLCTDLHGVRRTLVEKRARAILWVTGLVVGVGPEGKEITLFPEEYEKLQSPRRRGRS